MRECVELGIKRVWMHHGAGASSVSAAATEYGRQHGITVIDGGCPLMFGPTADLGQGHAVRLRPQRAEGGVGHVHAHAGKRGLDPSAHWRFALFVTTALVLALSSPSSST